MINIKKITHTEFNTALKRFLLEHPDRFWEIKAVYATERDLCWCSNDENSFYIIEDFNSNFCYFAFEENRLINIKGMYEALYQAVCEGRPFIRVSGWKGRYGKILKNFGYYIKDENTTDEDAYIVYVAHPENIKKITRRFE